MEEVKFHQVSKSLFMITYSFPNMLALVGNDGIILVDTNVEGNMPEIYDAIQIKFKNLPVKYVINTHSHGDHVGGNRFLINKGTQTIAHEFTRKDLSGAYYIDENNNFYDVAENIDNNGNIYYVDKDGKRIDYPEKGELIKGFKDSELPQFTLNKTMNLFFNDENVEIIHIEDAHTKGDVIVYFKNANIIALGDIYFGDAYTFGNNIKGMIKAYEKILSIINEKTIIVPGHGVLSNKRELQAYLTMIKDVKYKIGLEISKGKSLEQVKANTSLTEKYDDKYGKLYIKSEKFREMIFNDSYDEKK